MKIFYQLLIVVSCVLLPALTYATPGILKKFISTYPGSTGTQLESCRTCHLPALQNCLNPYALALKESTLDFVTVEKADSDGDGVMNIEEINSGQLPGSQAQADEVFLFTSRIGNITFNHEKHSLEDTYLSSGKCANCHSPETFPRQFVDTESWQKVAHKICKDCHKKSGSSNAPKRCWGCHYKEDK